jgi:hypothetical protein
MIDPDLVRTQTQQGRHVILIRIGSIILSYRCPISADCRNAGSIKPVAGIVALEGAGRLSLFSFIAPEPPLRGIAPSLLPRFYEMDEYTFQRMATDLYSMSPTSRSATNMERSDNRTTRQHHHPAQGRLREGSGFVLATSATNVASRTVQDEVSRKRARSHI